MICPFCGGKDQIVECGSVQIMYEVEEELDENGELSYGDSEIMYDSFEPADYPYYCRNCNRAWNVDEGDCTLFYFFPKEPLR